MQLKLRREVPPSRRRRGVATERIRMRRNRWSRTPSAHRLRESSAARRFFTRRSCRTRSRVTFRHMRVSLPEVAIAYVRGTYVPPDDVGEGEKRQGERKREKEAYAGPATLNFHSQLWRVIRYRVVLLPRRTTHVFAVVVRLGRGCHTRHWLRSLRDSSY